MEKQEHVSPSASRMEWLDAMRGFTMLLVVGYHVAQFSFNMPLKQSASMPFLVLLRMPLFFFVSGFLAYSKHATWEGCNLFRAIGRKMRVQLLPTLLFLGLFVLLMKDASWDTLLAILKHPTKGGFWFTWVLLLMFVFYYSAEALFAQFRTWKQRIGLRLNIPDATLYAMLLLWVAGVFWYETAYLPTHFQYLKQPFWKWSSLVEVARYFHFFLFGNIVRRCWPQVQRLFDTAWLFPVVCAIAIVCCGDTLKWHNLRMEWANLPRTVAMYSLLLMVVMAFRHYQYFFSSSTPVGRTLIYVGQRTLDIYLLHFFFLPHLPMVGQWLNKVRPGFVVEQVLTLGAAAFVVAACCIVSHWLRVSPVLRYYLFGRR